MTTFYDSSGNPDYYKVQVIFHDYFYSMENPDEGFAETDIESLLVDASSDADVKVSGLEYHLTMPGEGLVLVGAGILRFDTETGELFSREDRTSWKVVIRTRSAQHSRH